MNIEELRKEFEEIPEIKGILLDGYGFNKEINQYFHPHVENFRLNCAYLMGAWMAYFEKAKKLEGFVVVPVEATKEMAAWILCKHDIADNLYQAGVFYKEFVVEAARGGNHE